MYNTHGCHCRHRRHRKALSPYNYLIFVHGKTDRIRPQSFMSECTLINFCLNDQKTHTLAVNNSQLSMHLKVPVNGEV